MKVIFLDIDGVVNTLQINEDLSTKYYTELDSEVGNKQAVLWLNRLCLETDAKIVISSTWKHAGLGVCRVCLYNSGLRQQIEIIDKTPTTWTTRGEEIKQWLSEHPEVKNYVILDDDTDMDDLVDHLVKCNPSKGFLGEEYAQAKSLLLSGLDR